MIDVAEYSDSAEGDSQEIAYFQLKHTTVRKEKPFKLSDLKDTINGFAERYTKLFTGKKKLDSSPPTTIFSLVTNRPIDENLKRNISAIVNGGTVGTRFNSTLKKYTNLKGASLVKFCASLKFADGEGDYDAQRYELHAEISESACWNC